MDVPIIQDVWERKAELDRRHGGVEGPNPSTPKCSRETSKNNKYSKNNIKNSKKQNHTVKTMFFNAFEFFTVFCMVFTVFPVFTGFSLKLPAGIIDGLPYVPPKMFKRNQ